MKQFIFIVIMVLIVPIYAYSQTLVQTYLDPCDGKTYTITLPLPNNSITVVVRGKVKTFSYLEARTGAIQVWVNLIFAEPCPVTATVVVAQQAATAASSAATAASSAASAASSTAASAGASTAPSASSASQPSSQSQSSSGGSSSSSSSSESKSETKAETSSESKSESGSESKSESKEESKSESKEESKSGEKKKDEEKKKEEEKKKKQEARRANPPIVKADLAAIGGMGSGIIPTMNIGLSKSTEDGTINWGLNTSIRFDLKQIVVGGSMSSLIVKDGKIKGVTSTSMTYVTNWSDQFIFYGWSYIRLLNKGAVAGLSVSGNEMLIKDVQLIVAPSIILFYTRPYKIARKQTISPELYIISSPVMYGLTDRIASYDRNVSFFTGAGTDLSITRTFKLNLNFKVNISTNPAVPVMNAFSVGSKINL